MAVDAIIDARKLIASHKLMADVLTKGGRNGETLLESVRNGKLSIAGGTMISRSKKMQASTWRKLIEAQIEGFNTSEEAGLIAMIQY